MNILEITEMLKRMPDADLQTMTQNPSPDVPSWALLTETNRRNRTRQGAQAGTGAPPTVAQQLTQQIGQQQPAPTEIPQPGAQSQPRGLGSMMAQGAPKGYAGGGIVAFGGGGGIERGAGGSWVSKAKRLGYEAKDEADAYAWLQQQIRLQDPYAPGVTAPTLASDRELIPTVAPYSEQEVAGAYRQFGLRPPPARPAVPPVVPPAATQKLPPTAPVPGSAPSGLGSMRGVQIDPKSMRLPQQRPELGVMSEYEKNAAYMGEDEYGKALAADLAERRKLAAETKAGSRKQTLLDLGLGMMATKDTSFLGAAGTAGIKALEGQRAREADMSAEEKLMRREELGEVGRKQTEKRTGIAAAITAADVRKSENLQALAEGDKILNSVTVKNVEFNQDMLKENARLAAETKRFEAADKASSAAGKVAAFRDMSATVDDMQKTHDALVASAPTDPTVTKEIITASFATLDGAKGVRDRARARLGGGEELISTTAPTGVEKPRLN